MINNNRIITAQKQNDGKVVLEITNKDVFLEDGDRFKIFTTEDEVILRKISFKKKDTLERFFLEKEVNSIFKYLIEKDPERCKSNESFKYTMESALRYAWVKRMTKFLPMEDQDICAMMAMYDEELKEYREVMEELPAFQSKQGRDMQEDEKSK